MVVMTHTMSGNISWHSIPVSLDQVLCNMVGLLLDINQRFTTDMKRPILWNTQQ